MSPLTRKFLKVFQNTGSSHLEGWFKFGKKIGSSLKKKRKLNTCTHFSKFPENRFSGKFPTNS